MDLEPKPKKRYKSIYEQLGIPKPEKRDLTEEERRKAAEDKNAENLLVIRDKGMAEKYINNWKEHEGHPEVYKGKRE